MHKEENGLSSINDNTKDARCAICNKKINENDLIYITDIDSNNIAVHFNCYIEIQEKICSECGRPFKDQESLLFCEEHSEYFHDSDECIFVHLGKHMKFKKAVYDNTKNRISVFDENLLLETNQFL